jgi:hypothetical protein
VSVTKFRLILLAIAIFGLTFAVQARSSSESEKDFLLTIPDRVNLFNLENLWQTCRPNADQIAVFEHSNYRGRCAVRGIGRYASSAAFGLRNDTLSSIIIGQNVYAVLCKDNGFRGRCQTFRTTDPNLGNNTVGNDEVSSIRVLRKPTAPPPTPTCNPGVNQIAVFTSTNYRGRCAIRNIGNYASAASFGLPNDSLSSIKVGRNVRALVCRDVNFRGSCYSINGNEPDLNRRQIRQNQASSIRVIGNRTTPTVRPRHSPPNSSYVSCAVEGDRCNLPYRTTFAYGVNGRFRYLRNVSSVTCNNSAFGDPAPGIPKRCYFLRRNNSGTTSGGRTNVALRKRTSQSSNYSSGGQSFLAVDGNTNGNWASRSVTHTAGNGTLNAWWMVDLGRIYNINEIRLWNRTDCCQSRLRFVKVRVRSSETQPWQDFVCRGCVHNSRQGRNPMTLPGNKRARYVMVQLNQPRGILSLAEVQVFSGAANGQGATPGTINGRNVGIVNHARGTFTRGTSGKWFEYIQGKREIHATFTETGRDQWSVYLRKSDGARVRLNLQTRSISLSGRKIYTITTYY